MSIYRIGQKVTIKGRPDLPDTLKGTEAEVFDILRRTRVGREGTDLYCLRTVKTEKILNYFFTEDDIAPIRTRREYRHEITYLEDVVLAVLYDVTDEDRVEVARGHGHIIHEGALGIAQAAGYAMKIIHDKVKELEGGA